MKIQAVGTAGQSITKKNFDTIKTAAQDLGVEDSVELYTDAAGIKALGISATPALVIDGKVIIAGRNLNIKQAKTLIQKVMTSESAKK